MVTHKRRHKTMTNYEKAVDIYEREGQYGVFRAVHAGTLTATAWYQCSPCEDITPFEATTCLVCGTEKTITEEV